MALPGDTVFEVRTTGSDTQCGGGFSVANKGATGVDHSQQDSANATFTASLSGVGTTALTDAASGFTNAMLGNLINITGQGVYCIVGFTSSAVVTVDRALGTFSGGTGYEGGAFASPGMVGSLVGTIDGIVVHMKSGTYNTSATANVAGGKLSIDLQSSSKVFKLYGYGSTRLDGGTKPVMQANANSQTVLAAGRCFSWIENIAINGTGKTGITGISVGIGSGAGVHHFNNCKISNCDTNGVTDAAASTLLMYGCEVTGCTTTSGAVKFTQSTGGGMVGCNVHDNTVIGVLVSGNDVTFLDCIIESNTGSTAIHGMELNSARAWLINTVIYGNAGHGLSGAQTAKIINCVIEGQSGTTRIGVVNAANNSGVMINSAVYNNTTNVSVTGNANQFGTITGLGSFFVDGPNANFARNTTANAGALLAAAGYPGVLPGGTTTHYGDVGFQVQALTSTDPGTANVKSGTTYTINGSNLTGTLSVAIIGAHITQILVDP